MNIDLTSVDIKDKDILRDLLKEYQREILNKDQVEEYKYLDSYWQRHDSHPFFIEVDGKIAGFVLVNRYCLVEKEANSVSELYVKKEFRKMQVGKLSVFKVFDMFPGKWEIRELDSNIAAQHFWRKVISAYTNGNFKEMILNNDRWQGPVQVFEN